MAYHSKKILGIIPARGGSKGLPGKNILPVSGKPLIAWTIEAAKNSACLDRVIVSTEDTMIAETARACGAEVPFLRPAELAGDTTEMIDVILHADEFCRNQGDDFDILVLLQPTSPLRGPEDIDRSIEMLFELNAGAVISVCECEHHPYKSNTLPPDLCMKDFVRQGITSFNRQNYPVFYRVNGVVYTGYRDYVTAHKSFFGDRTFAYVMPQKRSVDIDGKLDVRIAECLLKGS